MKEIVLASTSPRRREILSFFAVPFIQTAPHFDETSVPFHGNPASFASEIAIRKALCVKDQYPDQVILAADTVVYREGRLFLKPETLEEAFGMLSELSGKQHTVYTGVCVLHRDRQFSQVEETKVLFHKLTESQIRSYHLTFNPLDKAGAYAIQKGGSVIVKSIEGCYYNIMGLPMTTTRDLLAKAGIDLWDFLT